MSRHISTLDFISADFYVRHTTVVTGGGGGGSQET